jgi:hypothetical protein
MNPLDIDQAWHCADRDGGPNRQMRLRGRNGKGIGSGAAPIHQYSDTHAIGGAPTSTMQATVPW